MTEIIFAKTRHVYDSYSDLWRLVELSGFPTVYVDEMDLYNPQHTYITAPCNGDLRNHMANNTHRVAKVCLWNLERPGEQSVGSYAKDNQDMIDAKLIDMVIVSDRELARQTNFHYVPVGSHEYFGSVGIAKTYDVVGLMCYSLRRAFLFDYLTPLQNYHGVTIAPNGWGEERHISLLKSRFMLSIHQDDHKFIEPLRFSLAAAYGLPIISEYATDIFPYISGADVILLDNIKKFDTTVRSTRMNYNYYSSAGIEMRKKMTGEYSFRRCIERYL